MVILDKNCCTGTTNDAISEVVFFLSQHHGLHCLRHANTIIITMKFLKTTKCLTCKKKPQKCCHPCEWWSKWWFKWFLHALQIFDPSQVKNTSEEVKLVLTAGQTMQKLRFVLRVHEIMNEVFFLQLSYDELQSKERKSQHELCSEIQAGILMNLQHFVQCQICFADNFCIFKRRICAGILYFYYAGYSKRIFIN